MIEIEGGVKGGDKKDDSLYATFSYGQEKPVENVDERKRMITSRRR